MNEPFPLNCTWWSHKFNGLGLRHEIGTRVQTGWISWVNGPCPAGQSPDLRIARGYLNQFLDARERHVVDSGCRDRHGQLFPQPGVTSMQDG